jgi:phage FluMu gp28-like protein
MARKRYTPGDELLSYQRAWVRDKKPFKYGLMARQTGKDFAAAFEGTADVFAAEAARQKTTWLIVAPSERQSLESLIKWKNWATAFNITLKAESETREAGPESILRSAQIEFEHGSRVIALPGKPETVRGFSANVLLTEFAFFEDQDKTWRAILPTITNPIGGRKKLRIITTPNGIGNKAFEIWQQATQKTGGFAWGTHKKTIYDAVKAGLDLDPEELRLALNDPEGWQQEYLCEFLDQQLTLLPYDLLATVESQSCYTNNPPYNWPGNNGGRTVAGIDFGRFRDLTIMWSLTGSQNHALTLEVLELDRMPTPRQVEIVSVRIEKCNRVAVDYTGAGIGMGDYLVEKWGEYNPRLHKFGKILLVRTTNESKCRLFGNLRTKIEGRKIFIPQNRTIREDLHSVNRSVTKTGKVTYVAPSSKDGHADRATALALANDAMEQSNGPLQVEAVGTSRDSDWPKSMHIPWL